MIDVLIQLLIFVVIFGLIFWVLQKIPLPEPFGQIARVVFIAIGCLILLVMLLRLSGNAHYLTFR